MAFSATYWAEKTMGAYVDNATAIRDYRAQLRGNKAIWLWGGYLGIMLVVTALAYDVIVSKQAAPISTVQAQLRSFYDFIISTLAGVVVVITPAMTAGAIIMEKQRRSLDLLFTAPVPPKQLLVGKMISSFRYTWMLLALSLPITAVCVLMGGASWSDVLAAYAMLSFCGIVCTSIGLLMSSVANTIGAAVIWTYICVGGYVALATAASSPFLASSAFNDPSEAPWVAGLSPLLVAYTAPTHMTVFGLAIPNWIFAGIAAMLMSKLLLLGAASVLSPFGSAETKSLRIHGLVYAVAICVLGGFPMASMISPVGFSSQLNAPQTYDLAVSAVAVSVLLAVALLMPHLSCYGADGGMKYRNDGLFNRKKIWVGTPSGSLPYLCTLWASCFATVFAAREWAVARYVPNPEMLKGNEVLRPSFIPEGVFFQSALWTLGFLLMWWAIGRFISSYSSALKNARVGYLAALLVVLGVPVPLIAILDAALIHSDHGGGSTIWMLHLFYPLSSPDAMRFGAIYAVGMGVVAVACLKLSRKPKAAVTANSAAA
jgi:ABC-type transport system involved in multi-copper enzyme maturation permease subunit